ncbi:MAG: DUF1499 domain-containing protein [Alphaproteobacteria bacterium]
MADLTDLSAVRPTGKPNCHLILPRGCGVGPAHQASPIFPVEAPVLARAMAACLTKSPRTGIVARAPDGLRFEAEERSRLFGFVDRISVRAVPQGTGRSALAFFSRSRIGYWDLGVNRRRATRLLAALESELAAARA